jgi:hypothetical protein
MNILNQCSFLKPEGVKWIEEKYNATYVFESCLKNRDGGWANFPAAIFYTKEAHPRGSNYFALYMDETGQPMITDGISATEGHIIGVKAFNNDVIYSRYRHDYRTSPDGTVFIDGGRDYLKSGMYESDRFVNMKVIKDKLEVVKL